MKEYFAALAASVVEAAPAPERPAAVERAPRRARRRDLEAVRRSQFEARVARACHASGEGYAAPPRTPPRVWALVRAVCNDTKGSTVLTALSVLPLELRHRARALVADRSRVTHPTTRYRVAMLCALSMLAHASRSRKGSRVVSGYCREALCGLIRSPLTGRSLSVSRVFGADLNAAPILPELLALGLVHAEQPGRDARGVPRGPSGWALNVYYLDGGRDEPAQRTEVDALASLIIGARARPAPD